MKAVVDYEDLQTFLAYLEDKTDDVYKREVQQAIERFLNEEITKQMEDLGELLIKTEEINRQVEKSNYKNIKHP